MSLGFLSHTRERGNDPCWILFISHVIVKNKCWQQTGKTTNLVSFYWGHTQPGRFSFLIPPCHSHQRLLADLQVQPTLKLSTHFQQLPLISSTQIRFPEKSAYNLSFSQAISVNGFIISNTFCPWVLNLMHVNKEKHFSLTDCTAVKQSISY